MRAPVGASASGPPTMSPLCGTMHAHHVIYRSHGGCDDDENLAVLCATHHQQGIHAGRLRCHGSADGFLRWELGVGAGGPPVLTAVEDVLLAEGEGQVSASAGG